MNCQLLLFFHSENIQFSLSGRLVVSLTTIASVQGIALISHLFYRSFCKEAKYDIYR